VADSYVLTTRTDPLEAASSFLGGYEQAKEAKISLKQRAQEIAAQQDQARADLALRTRGQAFDESSFATTQAQTHQQFEEQLAERYYQVNQNSAGKAAQVAEDHFKVIAQLQEKWVEFKMTYRLKNAALDQAFKIAQMHHDEALARINKAGSNSAQSQEEKLQLEAERIALQMDADSERIQTFMAGEYDKAIQAGYTPTEAQQMSGWQGGAPQFNVNLNTLPVQAQQLLHPQAPAPTDTQNQPSGSGLNIFNRPQPPFGLNFNYNPTPVPNNPSVHTTMSNMTAPTQAWVSQTVQYFAQIPKPKRMAAVRAYELKYNLKPDVAQAIEAGANAKP